MHTFNLNFKSLAIAPLIAALIAGCGSQINPDAGENVSYNQHTGTAVKVGIDNCAMCHADINARFKASPKIVQSAATLGNSSCLPCHNPDDDAANVNAAYGFAATGGAVGCEACHGAGSQHTGIGKIPVAKPAIAVCKGCHETPAPNHLAANPDGAGAWSDVAGSAHALSNQTGMTASAQPVCSKCHTDEGAFKYGALAATYAALSGTDGYFTAGAGKDHPALTDTTPVGCKTCHNPHGGLRRDATLVTSTEFNTCTGCHTISDAFHGGANPASWTETAANTYKFNDSARIISDTHVTAASDSVSVQGLVAGYVVKADADDACSSCHMKHESDLAISRDWARSAYAGKLLSIKESADAGTVTVSAGSAPSVPNSLTTGTSYTPGGQEVPGFTWARYNWDSTLDSLGKPDKGQCQVCHTATGLRNYMEALAADTPYDFRDNDFSHLKGWAPATVGVATAPSPQNEVMYCWGCHNPTLDKVFNPGPVAFSYYDTPEATSLTPTATLPDLGRSNLCVKCHEGRANMGHLVNAATGQTTVTAPATPVTGTVSPTLAHNYASTAILFQKLSKIGYLYYGESMYADIIYPTPHGRLVGAVKDGEKSGPCVTCHMEGAAGHTFVSKTTDSLGATVINNQAACDTCHQAMNGVVLDGLKEGYLDALGALSQALTDATSGAATYDRTKEGYVIQANGQPYTAWADLGTLGAAHNLALLDHEQGAYVHNDFYARRLIVDSIDWLDDGVLSGTITLDAGNYAKAIEWLGGDTTTGVVTRF